MYTTNSANFEPVPLQIQQSFKPYNMHTKLTCLFIYTMKVWLTYPFFPYANKKKSNYTYAFQVSTLPDFCYLVYDLDMI